MRSVYSPVEESEVLTATRTGEEQHLVLYNDDVNTFDFVIDALIEVCRHDRIQAEQCTYIIHYNGRCAVKDGPRKKLKPMCEALLDRGLSATIE